MFYSRLIICRELSENLATVLSKRVKVETQRPPLKGGKIIALKDVVLLFPLLNSIKTWLSFYGGFQNLVKCFSTALSELRTCLLALRYVQRTKNRVKIT